MLPGVWKEQQESLTCVWHYYFQVAVMSFPLLVLSIFGTLYCIVKFWSLFFLNALIRCGTTRSLKNNRKHWRGPDIIIYMLLLLSPINHQCPNRSMYFQCQNRSKNDHCIHQIVHQLKVKKLTLLFCAEVFLNSCETMLRSGQIQCFQSKNSNNTVSPWLCATHHAWRHMQRYGVNHPLSSQSFRYVHTTIVLLF